MAAASLIGMTSQLLIITSFEKICDNDVWRMKL